MSLDAFGNYVCDISPSPLFPAQSGCPCVVPVVQPFSYAPDSAVITWVDRSGHSHSGDLADFLAEANLPDVLSITMNGRSLTSFVPGNQLIGLSTLSLNTNLLTELDLSNLPALNVLYCNDNALTALDLSQLPSLEVLECSSNLLTSLDLSANPDLNSLNAYNMAGITTLDISQNPRLLYLDLGGDSLTTGVVDALLIALDGFGRSNGLAALLATAAPSGASAASRTDLLARGWTLQLD